MSPSRQLFELRAAPKGQRSGLFLVRGESHHLTLLVQPKPWATGGHMKAAGFDQDGGLSLLLCENQSAVVRCDPAQASFLDQVSERLALSSRPGAQQTDPLNGLLSLRRLHPTMDASRERARSPGSDDVVDLLRLAALGQPRTIEGDHGDPSGSNRAAPAPSGEGGADELLLLAQWGLVRAMEARVREVRRAYLSVTEPLTVIRGRITSHGWAAHLATELPELECTHDHFTQARPLFRVLVTAVEIVASGALFHRFGGVQARLFSSLRQRAAQLRMHLAGIPAYPIGQAASEASRVRLSRLDQTWERPLTLARQILHREPPALSSPSAQSVSTLLWSIPTDTLWQDILLASLGSDPRLKVQNGNRGAAGPVCPWGALGSTKRPDLLISAGPARVVADAKYKSNDTLSAQDQHQIFTYSHLATVDGLPPTACLVLRPLAGRPGTAQVVTHRRGGEKGGLPLHIVDLDFPERGELGTAGWNRYCARTSSWLVEELWLAPEGGKAPPPPGPQSSSTPGPRTV